MSSAKKRKIVDRRRLFQKEWTDMFFFIEEAGKPCCLMTSFCSTNEDVLTVSYEVSELIAKKLKPYDDGAWAKELLV